MVKADASTDGRLAVTPHVPGKAEARIGQEPCAVSGERGVADDGCGLQNAVDDGVIRGAALRLVPSVGGLRTEAGAELEARRDFDGVLKEACAQKRTPAHRGGRGNQGESGHGALQERLLRAEGGLAVLILREQIVGLHALQPSAGFDLLAAFGPVDVIVFGEEIARGAVVATHVGACASDGGSAV